MSYLDEVEDKAAKRLEVVQDEDVRMKALYKRYAKAVKRHDGKLAAEMTKAIQLRQRELAEELIRQQIEKDQRERAFARYMSGEVAAEYNMYRDAILIAYDALETIFNDYASLVHKNMEFVKLEYPKVFKECQQTIQYILKEELPMMDGKTQTIHCEIADNLAEMIINKAKSFRNKINN